MCVRERERERERVSERSWLVGWRANRIICRKVSRGRKGIG